MNRYWSGTCIVLAALFSMQVQAACTYPEDIAAPDGANSSEAEMLAGQKLVKQYMADMEAYLDCIDAEAGAREEKQTPEQMALDTKRYNAAVDAMEAVAAKFNDQVRAFKAAQ
jgi:hypothetical protein